jgi:hypothetical protein
MSSLFRNNYFYDLPDELQSFIYQKLFKETLNVISDTREALDNYNKLIVYIQNNNKNKNSNEYKNRAIWNIFLSSRRDVGDPYSKYFQYFADDDATNVLRLNKMKMMRNNNRYSTIRYIDFSTYPLDIRVSDASFICVKKILEEYSGIFLCNDKTTLKNEYSNIQGLHLLNDRIRIEYRKCYVFTNTIDIYNNILEAYNFITNIFDILFMYNHLYPEYDLEYMNDIIDLRNWFEYNSCFHGFTFSESGDIVRPRFYS